METTLVVTRSVLSCLLLLVGCTPLLVPPTPTMTPALVPLATAKGPSRYSARRH